MKRKILALGLFSLCCLTLSAQPAHAFFGLFSGWDPHHRYVTQITCRPYNAFTPICWGNLVCDGCCPSPCGVASGCLPMNMGVPPWANNGCGMGGCGMGGCGMGGCGMGGCGPAPCMGGMCGSPDAGYASDMQGPPPMAMPMQNYQPQPNYAPMPGPMPGPQNYQPQPNFTPPMPMPMGPNTTMRYPMNGGVSQANYYPNYYPMPMPQYNPYYSAPMGYNPYMAWPSPQPAPSYWYGQGR